MTTGRPGSTVGARSRTRHTARRARIFPGWSVVAGAFLLVLAGFGAIYSYAAFADDIAAAFDASLVSVSFIYALSGGACFMVSAVSGPLADRLGPRVPAVAGMLMVSLGLMVAATATSLIEIYAGYGLLIGLGTGFAYVPAMAAVQRWFTAHRGLASGIAASGIGVGTALVPPAADAFQTAFDWRTTFVAFGVFVAVIGITGALLLEPGGRRAPGRRAIIRRDSDAPPPALPQVVRSRAFAFAWFGTLLASVPATLPHAMLVGTARDLGVARGDALALLGLIGLGTIAGRFLIAAVADAIGRRATFLACCAGMAGSMVVWALAEDEPTLQAFALGFGALQGGFVALLPAFGADSFGARSVGGVLGVLYTGRGFALLLAPPALAGAIIVAGHALPVLVVAAAGLAGTVLLARTPRTPDEPAPPSRSVPTGTAGLALPAPRQGVMVLVLLALVVPGAPARAQPEFATMALVWATPVAMPGEAAPCARMLVLNLPRDWQAGDAAAIVVAPPGAGFAVARPVVAALLAQQAAVLELPDERGGGIGACAAAPIAPGAQVLGALAALHEEAAPGIVVAVGVGPSATAVFDALDAAGVARPQGPRFAGAAALDGTRPAAFRAGTPPPAGQYWPERAPHLCETLSGFAGPEAYADCLAAFIDDPPAHQTARSR